MKSPSLPTAVLLVTLSLTAGCSSAPQPGTAPRPEEDWVATTCSPAAPDTTGWKVHRLSDVEPTSMGGYPGVVMATARANRFSVYAEWDGEPLWGPGDWRKRLFARITTGSLRDAQRLRDALHTIRRSTSSP